MSTVVLAACQKKVTLFAGTKKYEASWLEVKRGPYAQYLDAFHFEFKPRAARKPRAYAEYSQPRTVVVEGWDHPEFDWLIRAIDDAPVVELSPGVTYRQAEYTVRRGQPRAKDKYELEFEDYVAKLDPSRVLLDTRGAVVTRKF